MKEVIVKPGINGFKYSLYTAAGGFIFNADSMKMIRNWYRYEIRHGLIGIRKELKHEGHRKSPREQQLRKGANVNQIHIDCNIKKPEVQGMTGLSSIRRKP